MKRLIKLALSLSLLVPVIASAHTISVGNANAGSVGSVSIFLGTYELGHGGAVAIEGEITLNGTTISFGNLVGNALDSSGKPSALVDGTNNFFHDGTLDANAYTASSNGTGQAERWWQSATFTGLAAGTYSYSITGMNTVNWANWGTFAPNWTGSVVIPGSSINTPEPSILALLGLGLAGLGFSRRRAV